MKTLTVAKKKVEKFYNENSDQAKKLKKARLSTFENAINECSPILEGKKARLLDEIVFKTVNNGVYHVSAATLKETCEVGRTTLAEFNSLLRETKQYIVARYRTMMCNCKGLVYIDTQHENFYDNMKFLFEMDMLDTDLYLSKIKTTVKQSEVILSEREKQQDIMNDFATNKYQTAFFNHIHEMPYFDSIKRYAYKMALKVNDNVATYQKAISSLNNIVLDIIDKNRVLENESDIVKFFAGSLRKALNYDVPTAKKEEHTYKPAPFYNWLEE